MKKKIDHLIDEIEELEAGGEPVFDAAEAFFRIEDMEASALSIGSAIEAAGEAGFDVARLTLLRKIEIPDAVERLAGVRALLEGAAHEIDRLGGPDSKALRGLSEKMRHPVIRQDAYSIQIHAAQMDRAITRHILAAYLEICRRTTGADRERAAIDGAICAARVEGAWAGQELVDLVSCIPADAQDLDLLLAYAADMSHRAARPRLIEMLEDRALSYRDEYGDLRAA